MAVCIALMPLSVFAAGLGKLNVSSGLGEPLKADIELISATPEELFSLTAAIASDEAYAAQGIDRPAVHANIQIELTKNASGNPILKLKTNQAINDPFLDMLIQVDWASGRLLREYTILLDPPNYHAQIEKSNLNQKIQAPSVQELNASIPNEANSMASKPAVDSISRDNSALANTNVTDSSNKKPAKKSKNKAAKSETAKIVKEENTEKQTPQLDEYVTKRGDTLNTIARQMEVEGVSLDQMLVGLYQANPKAFDGDNMNRLKVGQIIRAPDSESLAKVAQKQARSEVKLQAENWNQYRNQLAGIVKTSQAKTDDAEPGSAAGKLTSPAQDKAAQVNTGSKGVVKLSAGDVAKDKGAQTAASKQEQAKVAKLEEATAKEKAVKEEQAKAAELEKIKAGKDLLALKIKQMADMQKLAEEAKKVAAPAAATQAEANKKDAVAEAPAKEKPAEKVLEKPVDVATPSAVDQHSAKANKSDEHLVEQPREPATKAAPPAKVITHAPVVTAKPVEESTNFLTTLLNNVDTTLIGAGGGALALIGGAWMLLRNKRKRSLANFEEGILTSGGLKANTVFGNTAGGKVDTGDTSFLTDFSQSTSGSMIDTNDVDPIAEAEVYMAYGREAQAEEILKDAIIKEPKRYELHLKLLEMYAARSDTSAYETIAGELYTTLGSDDPTWTKIAEMGALIEPGNPLYQLASISTAPTSTRPVVSLESSDITNADAGEFDGEGTVILNKQDLDFSVPSTASFVDTAQIKKESADKSSFANDTFIGNAIAQESGFDFDLGDLGSDETTEHTTNSDEIYSEALVETHQDNDDLGNLDFAIPSTSKEIEQKTSMMDDKFGETIPATVLKSSDVTLGADFDTSSVEEIDFNFDLPEEDVVGTQLASETKDAKTIDLSGINLNFNDLKLPSSDSQTLPKDDLSDFNLPSLSEDNKEVETKLDLVAAYLEMEDKEGAKELLDEIIKEGSASQVAKAKTLLADIA